MSLYGCVCVFVSPLMKHIIDIYHSLALHILISTSEQKTQPRLKYMAFLIVSIYVIHVRHAQVQIRKLHFYFVTSNR